jgi:hypothetical protein
MTTPHTWTFDNGPIRSITAEPGRIVVEIEDDKMTINRKGDGHLFGFALMAQGRRDEVGALSEAYRIAWPDPVAPPDSIVVEQNIKVTP